jgi:hypothetical protein
MPTHSSGAADLRALYENISGHLQVAAATDDTDLVAAKTGHTIFIQKIVFNVTTDAAVSMSFVSKTSGKEIATVPASAGDNTEHVFDFGERGVPLTEGEAFQMAVSAAGYAGPLMWEGYRKQTAIEYIRNGAAGTAFI